LEFCSNKINKQKGVFMRRREGVISPDELVPQSVLLSTNWYIQPIGEFSNNAFLKVLTDTQECVGVMCADGKTRNFWVVTWEEKAYYERSRMTEVRLHFSVWYKNKLTGKAELWKSDRAYTHHKPSRKLLKSLTDGHGKPVPFPGGRAAMKRLRNLKGFRP
jgi:hypothetical protein